MLEVRHVGRIGARGILTLLAVLTLAASYLVAVDASPARATTMTVNNETEFKAALATLSSDGSGPHIVQLGADITYVLPGHASYSGSQDLTIEGNGYTIDANAMGRILYAPVSAGVLVTLQNLTLQGGLTSRPGGTGGAVYVLDGDLEVINSTIRDNWAGGANSAYDDGGGLAVTRGDLTLRDSSVLGNKAENAAGVVAINVVVINSTIANNVARSGEEGGGIFGETVTLINSTVSGNTGGPGSGVYSRGPLVMVYSTVAGNANGAQVQTFGGDLTSFGSVVAYTGTSNCVIDGETTSTYSYDDDGTCGFTDITDVSNGSDPLLGTLADNGGATWTRLPGALGDPLVDQIPAASCDATVTTDQRGVARPEGTGCDIGAVEIVQNQLPVADPNGPYVFPLDAGPFDGSGSSDPDGDTLSYLWDFGDAGSATGVAPSHTYSDAGIYDVCLTVDDGWGGTATACTTAVVYDPSAGFVTGGGWIYSEAGNYLPDLNLEGKATFGFVSKYKKGASVPTGNTEFQFHAGDLNFHSTSYDWLVVTGSNTAKFKGTGTINGEGTYKFQIWAGDDDPDDTFRIKIWYEDGGEIVVYDNGHDQAIGAGSIIVHTKKK